MITANLSGCAIAMSNLGQNRLQIAHIRPNADMDNIDPMAALSGAEMHKTLSRSGWTAVYGRHDYAATKQVVVDGVRRGGHWQIFAQKQTWSRGPGDIMSVKRIFG